MVEIKAAKSLTKNDEAQIINSLKGSKQKVGLLINFGELSLKFKRFVYWNGSNIATSLLPIVIK